MESDIGFMDMWPLLYEADDRIEPEPPLHVRCRCVIEALKARLAGTATKNGKDGADWWLKNRGKLPDYYVTQAEAKACGYRPIIGNLAQVLPGNCPFYRKRRRRNRIP